MRQWTIDAFASAPFKGNPACVVEPFDAWPSDGAMHALAAENNQAETAFLLKTGEPGRYGLRWMTPTMEVPLCGHATLASAHSLVAEQGLAAPVVVFDTLSGPLTVRRAGEGYEMDFPADVGERIDPPAGLVQAIGAEPLEVWRGRLLVAVLKDEHAVRGLSPDLGLVAKLPPAGSAIPGEVAVTARADPDGPADVVSRFFAPGAGIPEDPTTGSLHTLLSTLWSAKLGRSTLRYHQAFPGRGGDLECEHRGDRVLIRGRAVTVLESRLRVALG